MKTMKVIFFGMTVIFMSIVSGVQAQGKFNAAFGPSLNVPVTDLGSTELKNGGGFEAVFAYQFLPGFALYGGWGWNTFSPKGTSTIAHFEETGYRFGIQRIQPIGDDSKMKVLFGAGAIANHIETENADGNIIDDTGHGFGWEVDAGLSIPLSDKFQIVPGIRYHSLSRTITNDGSSESVDLNYLRVGVMVSWTLVE